MVKFVLFASSIGAVLGHVDGLKLAKNVSASNPLGFRSLFSTLDRPNTQAPQHGRS
jgi:hypothetical protein